ALWQQETDVDQTGKTGRVAHHIEPHASRAQVERLHLQFLTVGIPQGYRQVDFRAKELLLVADDDAELCRAIARRHLNVILTQFAAERTAGNSELVGGLGAMPAALLESSNDHLLFHVFK